MLVLFESSDAIYFADYLFIIPVYIIITLDVILLLCISIASVAGANYFI